MLHILTTKIMCIGNKELKLESMSKENSTGTSDTDMSRTANVSELFKNLKKNLFRWNFIKQFETLKSEVLLISKERGPKETSFSL